MTERFVESNGVRLWTESFGDRRKPTLLLVMGAGAQGIQWPEAFIARFVEANFHVVRYDHRDTGKSTCLDFAKHPYVLSDLALDAIGVLDDYAVDSAHVAGASMGGMVAQTLMIHHQARLRSASLIMTTPLAALSSQDLPGPDAQWLAEIIALNQSMSSNTPSELIEMRAQLFMKLAGRLRADKTRALGVATREVERAINFAAKENHNLALLASLPIDRRAQLRETSIPTLVIHGTDDPILHYAHGQALAAAIPGAELLTIDGMGHDLPIQAWPQMVKSMVALMTQTNEWSDP